MTFVITGYCICCHLVLYLSSLYIVFVFCIYSLLGSPYSPKLWEAHSVKWKTFMCSHFKTQLIWYAGVGSVGMKLITWWVQKKELTDLNGFGLLGSARMELNQKGTHWSECTGSIGMEVIKWWEENQERMDRNGLSVLGPVRMEEWSWIYGENRAFPHS